MLERVSWAHHLVVGGAVAGCVGSSQRRGHERFIPVDFGVPTDVTINGQHRYELGFTLPAARLSSGELALDIIGTDETIETDRFEVVVAGFDLREPRCNVGRIGASGGCSLSRDGDVYRTVIEPLASGQGITIGGTIEGIVAFELPDPPPLPERRSTPDRRPLALGLLPVGFGTAAAVYRQSSRRGRDEVFAGGAADAAFGTLPPPGVDTVPITGDVAVDDEAWSRALEASNVPPSATATSSPLLVHTMRSALSSATTPPSSSGSGGSSGGLSGGSVGGGGDGRSGSW